LDAHTKPDNMSMGQAHSIQPEELELEQLAERDLPVTEHFLTDPEMMEHLGGAQMCSRHTKDAAWLARPPACSSTD
jgi:hypothetical protein